MKNTIIMLSVTLTFIITWMTLSFICYLLSDPGTTFRSIATDGGMGMFLIVFGWIPSLVVAFDIDKNLK